jgi:hypothetical protein
MSAGKEKQQQSHQDKRNPGPVKDPRISLSRQVDEAQDPTEHEHPKSAKDRRYQT